MRKYETLREIPISTLKRIVKKKESFRSILLEFDLDNRRCNRHEVLKEILNENNIDYSHFTGQAWNKGKKTNYGLTKEKFINEYLVDGKKRTSSRMKYFILKFKILKNKCYECGLKSIWNNKKLVMHLEHKNGNNKDNRKENLTLLCPNCHSQTETYCRSGSSKFLDPLEKKNYFLKRKREINNILKPKSKKIMEMFKNDFSKSQICELLKVDMRILDRFLQMNELERICPSKKTLPKEIIRKRSKDFLKIEKKRGFIKKLSNEWNISHTRVISFIKKYFPDFYSEKIKKNKNLKKYIKQEKIYKKD